MIGSFSVSKPDRHRERISVLLRAVALSGFFWSSILGCVPDDDSDRSEVVSCDPFAENPAAITLEQIIAVGQDAQGVVYVVDKDTSTAKTRAFISEGETLYRLEVQGSGEGTSPEGEHYSLTVATAADELSTLLVEIDTVGTTTMAFVRGEDYEGPIADIGVNGEVLEVRDDSVVSDMAVRNLENVVVVEYFAEVENGDTVLVTRPKYDMRGVEDMGLFYGAAPELIERRVSEFLRASDGGSTVIVFGLGGEKALAKFPVRLTEEGLEWEPATLTIGGDTLALTRREPDDFVAHDYTFECFDD